MDVASYKVPGMPRNASEGFGLASVLTQMSLDSQSFGYDADSTDILGVCFDEESVLATGSECLTGSDDMQLRSFLPSFDDSDVTSFANFAGVDMDFLDEDGPLTL